MRCGGAAAGAARATVAIAVAAAGGARPRPAGAQPTLPGVPGRQAVTVGVAIEPALVLVLGYARRVGPGAGSVPRVTPRETRVGADIMLPTTALARGAWRANLRVLSDPVVRGDWSAPVTAATFLARTRNAAGSMLGAGVELRAAPGRYGARGGIGLDLGWQVTAATRVTHAAAARAAFDHRYPTGTLPGDTTAGPRDGWYRLPAQRYRVGMAGARRLGRNGPATLWGAGGSTLVRQKQGVLVAFDLAQVPFYAEAGVRVAW